MMKGYDTWIQFENDICDKCNKSKYGKIKILNGTLTFIVSCDCDTCVFRDEWKAETNLIVVLDPDGVNTTLRMIAEHMGEK
tara:strand:+ start:1800 stop:2042 length:243 start_codon:yes stop_codon:yes gene_type:complete